MSWLPSPEFADWWYGLSWKGIIGFGAVTAVAAAATVAFTVIQFWSDGIRDRKAEERQHALEVQTAEARAESDRANEAAATANAEAAKANERAATLERESAALRAQAEADRLARVKIEEKLAPRSLSGEQQRAIAEAIKPFAPTKFQIVMYQDDQEIKGLATALVPVLIAAGWEGIPQSGFLAMQLEVGVRVEFSADDAGSLAPAAKALAESLNANGVAATWGVREKLESSGQIKIRIGKKP